MSDGRENSLAPPPKGNLRALKHGATSSQLVGPRAAEIAADLVQVMPAFAESDRPAANRLGELYARLERAYRWLDQHDLTDGRNKPWPILERVERWETSALALEDRLGLNPQSRAKLGLAVAKGESLAAELERMKQGGDLARARLARIEESADG